jgi:hypothetical protein
MDHGFNIFLAHFNWGLDYLIGQKRKGVRSDNGGGLMS